MEEEDNIIVKWAQEDVETSYSLLNKYIIIIIIIISNLSNDRSKASSRTIPPHSAIYSFLLQLTVSSPVLKVIQ